MMYLKSVLGFIVVVFCFLQANATHNRAGEIIYRSLDKNSPEYEMRIITYTNAKSDANRDSLTLTIFACGVNEEITSLTVPIFGAPEIFPSIDNSEIQKNTFLVSSFTFPGPGCYRITMQDPNRINGIANINREVSDGVPFYLEDTLMIRDPQFEGYNSSPILVQPPIDLAAQGQTFVHNPAAYDPDGDSLHFSLIVPKENAGIDVPNYTFPDNPLHEINKPNSLAIDSITGEMTWDVAQKTGIYNVAILIREFRDGKFLGSIIRDMQIVVVNNDNRQPNVEPINDTCIVAGDILSIPVYGSDPDEDQLVFLSANGGPFVIEDSAQFTSNPNGANPIVGLFEWQTTCKHVRPQFYSIVFKAEDNFSDFGGNQPFVDFETWIVRVMAPAPTGLTSARDGKAVELAWDAYPCSEAEDFLGYTVWRKAGCDETVLDVCEPGNLSQLGYTRISGFAPIQSEVFKDEDVKYGVFYSYRIMAEFAKTTIVGIPYNEVSSLASDETCIEIRGDVPLLTHATVDETGLSTGEITVNWANPFVDVFDTLQNRGPYRYELFRSNGINIGGAATPIYSYEATFFTGLVENTFVDNGLNTAADGFTYTLNIEASNSTGQKYVVSTAEIASSVYLSFNVFGEKLELKWRDNTPWDNFKYVVEKRTNGTTFDSIGATDANAFEDFDVEVGKEYCYRIRAMGSYFNPELKDTFINYSQIGCAVPIDTVAPCEPILTAKNGCSLDGINSERLENTIQWAHIDGDCAQDVKEFRLYYKTVQDAAYTVLETFDKDEGGYIHSDINSLAGCYYITAVDFFGNESIPSNEVCLDNCPVYRLPNVFTPNGDGDNEQFVPFQPYHFIDHIELQIFNKWGGLVFESTDPAINWNGKLFNTGKLVSDGTYYYSCEVYETRLEGVVKRAEPLSGFIHVFSN